MWRTHRWQGNLTSRQVVPQTNCQASDEIELVQHSTNPTWCDRRRAVGRHRRGVSTGRVDGSQPPLAGSGRVPGLTHYDLSSQIDVTAVRRSWILDAIHGHSPSPVSVIGEDFWMPAHCYWPDDARHRLDHTDATLLDRS